MGEYESDKEDYLRASSTAPYSALLPGDPEVEAAQAPAFDT